jgi:putative ABC transport system substrate-binding protein
MKRRHALPALIAFGTLSFASFAQRSRKVWRIAFLHLSNQASVAFRLEALKQGFAALGYAEGTDYVLEQHYADDHPDRLPALAAEVVASRPDLIIANSATPTIALQKTTSTIPIVFLSVGDPIGSGVVRSLSHPGGNCTGTSNSLTDIAPKHLELLHEVAPKASRLAVLMNPSTPSHRSALEMLQTLSSRVGALILPIEASSGADIPSAFLAMTKQRAQGVIVLNNAIIYGRRAEIAQLAIKARLPCVGSSREVAEAGFLMGYGPETRELYRRTAVYVDKILKGIHPGDLPVEQPTIFELAVNRVTAKAIGLTIPNQLVLRADRVIQ